MSSTEHRTIPEATIARLPGYLRVLKDLQADGVAQVSSTLLAERAGVQAPLVRRDLSTFGSYGTRGVGYEVDRLAQEVGALVGTQESCPVMIVGIGNMGHALAQHLDRLPDFRPVALVDRDPSLVGTTLAGLEVVDQSRLEEVVAATAPRIAILTTPAAQAPEVARRLSAAGVHAILNFAPVALPASEGTTIRAVDLAQELHILAYHDAHRTDVPQPGTARQPGGLPTGLPTLVGAQTTAVPAAQMGVGAATEHAQEAAQ